MGPVPPPGVEFVGMGQMALLMHREAKKLEQERAEKLEKL